MELTLEQARQYLASVGVTLPDFMLELLVLRVNEIDDCLIGAGYSDGTAMLIKLYALGLLGLTSGDKYVTSESAPNGASRSYRYGTLAERYTATLRLLEALDRSGCTSGLVPPNPTAASAGLWVSTGCRA